MNYKNPVADYYENKLAESKDSEDLDYYALAQGVERTKDRHDLILFMLGKSIKGNSLLDVGCGTGLFVDSMLDYGCIPNEYIGTDILDGRGEAVEKRVKAAGIPNWRYKTTGEGVPTPKDYLGDQVVDVAVCIGITGFWGMHTYAQCVNAYFNLLASSRTGCMVFPRYYQPGKLGIPELTRFDPQDLQKFINADARWCNEDWYQIDLMEREMLLFWERGTA